MLPGSGSAATVLTSAPLEKMCHFSAAVLSLCTRKAKASEVETKLESRNDMQQPAVQLRVTESLLLHLNSLNNVSAVKRLLYSFVFFFCSFFKLIWDSRITTNYCLVSCFDSDKVQMKSYPAEEKKVEVAFRLPFQAFG